MKFTIKKLPKQLTVFLAIRNILPRKAAGLSTNEQLHRIHIDSDTNKRTVGWLSSEITNWTKQQACRGTNEQN